MNTDKMSVEQAWEKVEEFLDDQYWSPLMSEARVALATLRAELADMREELDATIEQRGLLSQEVLRLEGELDGLRADAERYRWLRERREEPDIYVGVDSGAYPGKWALMGEDADAAIDAARQEKGHE